MDGVYGIVREICIFIIITAIVDNLLQGSGYRKYVKLVSGIMITLIIIKPVLDLISLGEAYSGSVDRYINNLDIKEYEREMKMYADADGMPSYYSDMLRQSLKEYLESEGYELKGCEWKINDDAGDELYGSIEGVNVTVSSGSSYSIDDVHIDDNGQVEIYNRELGEKIAAYYGMAADRVEVVVE